MVVGLFILSCLFPVKSAQKDDDGLFPLICSSGLNNRFEDFMFFPQNPEKDPGKFIQQRLLKWILRFNPVIRKPRIAYLCVKIAC